MEPKFQSSFIPKGPISDISSAPMGKRAQRRDFLSSIASVFFVLAILVAGGVFLYKLYLNYRIEQAGIALENARATLSPETVDELIRVNKRVVSAKELLNQHKVLSPVFDFLEASTPQSVRYTDFNYASTDKGVTLILKGQARSYSALAQAAEVFNKTSSFKDPSFSDLTLDEKGNVIFSVTSLVVGDILSYEKLIEKLPNNSKMSAPSATFSPSSTSSPQATN
ncbi:MAG: hypothetical protein AAB758_01925 [Patescibacteria group bacterium]